MNPVLNRAIGLLLLVAVIAGVVYAVVRLTADDDSADPEQIIVIDEVGRATLQDTVVLRGGVAREQRFVLNAPLAGRVTSLPIEEDTAVQRGDVLLHLNGRPMIAARLETPFWRPLSRFADDGPDVETLELFLDEAGYDPGTIDQQFTSTTLRALESWQEDHGYVADGVFQPTDLAVADWPATVGPIELDVGGFVAAGAPLLTFVEDDPTIVVDVDPTDRSRLIEGLPAEISVPATGAETQGRIVELDDAATVDPQGNQRYRGEVSLTGPLDVVDGTAVRVEVILTEVTDALVVPVAAVSLSGDGTPEVRILSVHGTIDRVPVQTGLSEGALVEILDGLDGSEQVVVEVRTR